MTTRYLVKKCETVSFVQNIDLALEIVEKNKIKKSICRENIEGFENSNLINFSPCNDCCVIVELAFNSKKNIEYLEHKDGDYEKIVEFFKNNDVEKNTLSLSELQECIHIFKNLCEDINFLNEQEMKPKFLDFLVYIYPQLMSSELKFQISNILRFNNVNIEEISKNYPLKRISKTIPCVVSTEFFKDISVIVDEKAEGLSSSMYKTSHDDLKRAALGQSASLDAFTKGTFTVLRGRKGANIENSTLKQNNEVLNLLAANGVVCTPESTKILSMDLLMKKLSKVNNFQIIFVHPSLEQKVISFDSPSEFFKPEYILNSGELIAIAYRYILIHFFGQHSIINEDKLEYQYLF
jgi:hypothetical protein